MSASDLKFLTVLFLAAAAVSTVSLPCWIRVCRRMGLVDDPGQRKIHREPMPLAGGLGILGSLLLSVAILWLLLQVRSDGPDSMQSLRAAVAKEARTLGLVLAGAIGMLALGVIDDRQELRPGAKFLAQLAIALAITGGGVRITLFLPWPWLHVALTVFWILGVTNAVNFLDNMNGLCAGLTAISAISFGLFAAVAHQPAVAALAFLTAGASAGFLPWNFPRAMAFLGDAGSHLLGFLVAVLAILPSYHHAARPHRWAVLSPLLILAVPLADLGWVVLLRWRAGRPFYIGDTNHLSHRLVRRGLSPAGAVLCIWLVSLLLGAAAWLL